MNRFLALLFVTLIYCEASKATDEVWLVGPSGSTVGLAQSEPQWKVGEKLCVVRDRWVVGCGQIEKAGSKSAVAVLAKADLFPKSGDQVLRGSLGNQRTLASVPASIRDAVEIPRDAPKQSRFSLGVVISNPYLHYETLLVGPVTVGGSLSTMSTGLYEYPQNGYGLLGTVTIYPQTLFEDLWIQLAPGIFTSSLEASGSAGSFSQYAVQISTGWRLRWGDFTLGGGVGAQYYYQPANTVIALKREFLLPVLLLDAGVVF